MEGIHCGPGRASLRVLLDRVVFIDCAVWHILLVLVVRWLLLVVALLVIIVVRRCAVLVQCDGRQLAHEVDHLLVFLVLGGTLHLRASGSGHSPCVRLLSFGSRWGGASGRCKVLWRSASQFPPRDPVSLLGLLIVVERFLGRSVTAVASHRVKAFRQ